MATQTYKADIVSFNRLTGVGNVKAPGGSMVATTNFPSWSDPGFNPSKTYTSPQLNLYTQSARAYLPLSSPYRHTLDVKLSYAYGEDVLVMITEDGRHVILGAALGSSSGIQVPSGTSNPPSPPAVPGAPVDTGGSSHWRAPVATLADLYALKDPVVGQTHFVVETCTHWVYSGDACGGWKEAGGNGGELELPTDGEFGGENGNISGIAEGDTYDDAFDKIETVLGLLAPKRPKPLSEVALFLPGAYSAREQGTGVLRVTVTDDPTPTLQTMQPFGDGNRGTLYALLGGSVIGSRVLTAADDTGVYDGLSITSDADPYAEQFGKTGFYKQLSATVSVLTALSPGSVGYDFSLQHSVTGQANLTVFVDDPQNPTVTPGDLVAEVQGTPRYVSGVPCLQVGDRVRADFVADQVISAFFHATCITEMESPAFDTVASPLPLDPAPTTGDLILSGDLEGIVKAGVYSPDVPIHRRAYNSKGDFTTVTTYHQLRVDTRSDESERIRSGVGQFPNRGLLSGEFGEAYDPLESLVDNEELQLENGEYRYPALIDYSGLYPTPGPNYSTLPAGSHNSLRWVTFELGQVVNANSVTFEIDGASNFGNLPLVSGCEMYLKVEGATGWLNANAAYPGVGDPTNNGAAALAISLSTGLKRYVTFGTTVRTGTVYVRIGLPPGSNKRFVGVTKL